MSITIRRTFEAMGHKQQATRLKTDNDTANSFVHSTIRLKRSKTWDMRYNWLRGGIARALLKVFWDRGKKIWLTTLLNPIRQLTTVYNDINISLRDLTFHSPHSGRGCIHPLCRSYLLSYIPRISLPCESPLHIQSPLSVTIRLTYNGQNSILS